jgi:hypothetical protein
MGGVGRLLVYVLRGASWFFGAGGGGTIVEVIAGVHYTQDVDRSLVVMFRSGWNRYDKLSYFLFELAINNLVCTDNLDNLHFQLYRQ